MRTLEFTDVLTIHECWSCGISYAMPRQFEKKRREDGGTFYCPNGHGAVFRKSTATIEKERREAAEQETQRLRDRLVAEANAREALRRRHAATKGQLTKVRKRADAGVCQHCNRSFANVARHVAHMHPESAVSS